MSSRRKMFLRRVQEALGLSRRYERTAAPPEASPGEGSQAAKHPSPADLPRVPVSHADTLVLREMHSLTRRILKHQAVASARREKDLLKQLGALESRLYLMERRLLSEAASQAQAAEQWQRKLGDLTKELEALRSTVRPPVVVSPSGVIAVEVDGFLIGIPAEDWRLAGFLAVWGTLERGLLSYFKQLVKPGMTVVDIGANVGLYTLHAARLAGPGGAVYSFEPSPRVFPFLEENVALNGFAASSLVHCTRVAVTDRVGESDLFFQEGLSGHSTLFPRNVAGERRTPVPSAPLDDLVPPGTKVDVIKMDAEGSEPLIWRGMDRVIQENPGVVLLMEFAPSHLVRAGVVPMDFLAELGERGFQFGRLEAYSGEVQAVSLDFLADCYSENLCLRRTPQ